jgi:hypothetical protein
MGVYAIEEDSNHLSVFRKSCLKSGRQVRSSSPIDNLIFDNLYSISESTRLSSIVPTPRFLLNGTYPLVVKKKQGIPGITVHSVCCLGLPCRDVPCPLYALLVPGAGAETRWYGGSSKLLGEALH